MIKIEVNSEADTNWNKRMLDYKLGTFQQTREYAESKKLLGYKPIFLTFLNTTDKIVGQLLILQYSFSQKGSIKKFFTFLKNSFGETYRWVYGPVIFDLDYNTEICESLQNFILTKKCRVWGSEHPFNSGLFSSFKKPFCLKQWSTFMIDLTLDLDALWKNLDRHSARKNIERSKERSVTIKKITKNELKIYDQLRHENKKSNNNTPSLLEKHWDILQPVGYAGFLAFENDIPLGGILVSSFNGYINEFGIVRTEKDRINKLYSQDLLKWTIIQWGKENNFKYYDLTGVNPNPIDEKEKGIFKYKQKWGGNLFTYNIVRL